jgi:hypothetical protein
MDHVHRDVPGERSWVPWLGLGLVLPAVIVLLVATSGLVSSSLSTPGGLSRSEGPGISGMFGGVVVAIAAFGALGLGTVGLVRGLRRSAPRNGRSFTIAGVGLEVAVIALAVICLGVLLLLAR